MKVLVAKNAKSLPIRRLAPDAWQKWRKTAPARWLHWLDSCGFKPDEKGGMLGVPDAKYRLEAVVQGASADAFADGAKASKLAAGVYHLDDADADVVEAFALGWALEHYDFSDYRAPKSKPHPQAKLAVADAVLRKRVAALAAATALVRDLINAPANHLTPKALEASARKLSRDFGGKITITKGAALAKKFPAIHAVGRAAEVPPRLIDLRWGRKGKRVTLIGKGITFDSGGLDIKPSSGMEIMKKDMGGAAHVLGLAQLVMALKLPLRLRVLIPAAENAISAKAMRPLDVIDTAAGIPVEVGNTDAEGRLVLADALHLATQQHNDVVIDFATLTGAARVALGTNLPALFCNDADLQQELLAHGDKMRDPLWALPLHAPYDAQLDQGYAALSSTGAARYGGAITAALFLQRFLAKPQKWAHIDVMAWNLSARPGHPKGGEAMGMRAVFSLLEAWAKP